MRSTGIPVVPSRGTDTKVHTARGNAKTVYVGRDAVVIKPQFEITTRCIAKTAAEGKSHGVGTCTPDLRTDLQMALRVGVSNADVAAALHQQKLRGSGRHVTDMDNRRTAATPQVGVFVRTIGG